MGSEAFAFAANLTAPGAAALYNEKTGYGFVTEQNTAAQPRLQILELNSGFAPAWWYAGAPFTEICATEQGCAARFAAAVRTEDTAERRNALTYKVRVPVGGAYRVTVTLAAPQQAANKPENEPENKSEILLFLGRRRLAWRGALMPGERFTGEFIADVSPIIPRTHTESMTDDSVDITVVGGCLRQVAVEKTTCPTVFVVGDSTVTDQTADLPYAPGTSYSGWGQMLPAFLPGYSISNHAHSGLTTESFRSEGHYAVMKPLVRQGDICLLQFGHNDQKLAHLQADGGYTERLARYIEELRGLGAVPVLVTPLARNSWNAAGQYNDLLAAYADACFALGRRLAVPVVDLHAASMAAVKAQGVEAAKVWYFPGDYTHTNDFGAYKMAGVVASGLAAAGVVAADGVLSLPAWPPCPPFAPLTPPADCSLVPPDGGALPFADFADTRPNDPLTRVEALEIVIQAMHFFPINVYNDLYGDVVGHETFAGTVQCAAQNGLIPPDFVADGNLYPLRTVTLAEFLQVLMPGYRSRRAMPKPTATALAPACAEAVAAGLLPPAAAWNECVTRKWAAEFCRGLKI